MELRARIDAALARLITAINAVDAKTGGAAPATGPHGQEPGVLVGGYISATMIAGALSTVAGAAGRIDFYPYRPGRDRKLDELALEVTTLIAGSQARIGIYSSTVAELPFQLLTGAGALLDCATIGAKASPIAPAITLTAGTLYWIAVHTSSTQTVRGLAAGAVLSLGHTATGTTVYSLRRATVTFALGLPAVAPATTLTSAVVPWVRMRIGA